MKPSLRPLASTTAVALAAAWVAAASPALAQDTASPVTSRIARVTVYPGSATVERVAKVPAGARSITLGCLPASLDARSLQINADPAVRVGEFECAHRRPRRGGRLRQPAGRPHPRAGRPDRCREGRSRLAATGRWLPEERGYRRCWQPKRLAAACKQPAPAPDRSTADALRKSAHESQTRAHQLQRKQEALELALKPLAAERERTASQRAQVVSIAVTLATDREAELRLSYQVRGTGWQPTYRATLRRRQTQRAAGTPGPGGANRRRGLEQRAARPSPPASPAAPPRAACPARGRWTSRQPTPKATRCPPWPWRAPAPHHPLARRNVAEDALPSFEVTSTDKAFATEFAVPQRITVPSNGQRVTLALGSYTAPATLITRTAPAMEEAAYLVAESWPRPRRVAGGQCQPVPRRRLSWARAASTLPRPPAPMAPAAWPLGATSWSTVRAEPVQDLTGSAGFTGSRVERRTRRAYTVENRHNTTVTLQVLHAAPQSRNEKIEVESRYQPQPTDLAWNRNPGTVGLAAARWPPGPLRSSAPTHTIRYAKDLDVQERQ